MTPEQIATNRYLIKYKDAHGLLLPQYGGEWEAYTELTADRIFIEHPAVNLFTPDGFFALWEAMQAREDWTSFLMQFGYYEANDGFDDGHLTSQIDTCHINPLTLPGVVAAYLKEREGK